MPKMRREALAAVIVVELLLKGVHFDSASVRRMPWGQTSITRTLHGLIEAGIISKSPIKGKYRLTDEFVDSLQSEMTEGMPRGIFIHFPDLRIFDISGVSNVIDLYRSREYALRALVAAWMIELPSAGESDLVDGLVAQPLACGEHSAQDALQRYANEAVSAVVHAGHGHGFDTLAR